LLLFLLLQLVLLGQINEDMVWGGKEGKEDKEGKEGKEDKEDKAEGIAGRLLDNKLHNSAHNYRPYLLINLCFNNI
jgi:hypothetical protein